MPSSATRVAIFSTLLTSLWWILFIYMVPEVFTKQGSAGNFGTSTKDSVPRTDSEDTASDCSVRLAAPGTFPVIALASPPGSGNTWTRHLIQQATGFYTGSEYNVEHLAKTGYAGELEDWTTGTTLTVKTHSARLSGPGMHEKAKAAIVLLRNPCSVAVAERNRRLTRNQTSMAYWNNSLKYDKEWFRAVEWQMHLFERFANNWLELGIPVHVVFYENIQENAVREMKRIVKFVNLTVDENRMVCVRKNTEGNYHRQYSSKAKLYEEILSPEIKRYSQMVMERVSVSLVKHGQNPVPWRHLPPEVLP
ncbi:sialate:O-sulfotransferase 1-like isoform X1 [Ptychodera flava]|uniref:sialate:O-sulfotransferase 1-like isoform X1 n=1 Tax=Ptychodera flava TaxID=63121 RepID=UPI00396A4A92